jgi:hypothetical protein
MNKFIFVAVIIVMTAASCQAQQAYFINAVGDTLYSRCCTVSLELDKGLTPAEEKAERKQYRKDRKAGRYFNRVVKAYIRRDMRQMVKHSKQPAL